MMQKLFPESELYEKLIIVKIELVVPKLNCY